MNDVAKLLVSLEVNSPTFVSTSFLTLASVIAFAIVSHVPFIAALLTYDVTMVFFSSFTIVAFGFSLSITYSGLIDAI